MTLTCHKCGADIVWVQRGRKTGRRPRQCGKCRAAQKGVPILVYRDALVFIRELGGRAREAGAKHRSALAECGRVAAGALERKRSVR